MSKVNFAAIFDISNNRRWIIRGFISTSVIRKIEGWYETSFGNINWIALHSLNTSS